MWMLCWREPRCTDHLRYELKHVKKEHKNDLSPTIYDLCLWCIKISRYK